jgi:hypothetical protein
MKWTWRRWVTSAVFAGCIAWIAFQGWQTVVSALAVLLGLLFGQALLRWEKRGKN